jgi:hypothetical protein
LQQCYHDESGIALYGLIFINVYVGYETHHQLESVLLLLLVQLALGLQLVQDWAIFEELRKQ